MHKNTLNLFLKELNIKHTNSYSSSLFEEHPNKYNLYGISQMLNLYNIPNIGIKVENKDLNSLELRFVTLICKQRGLSTIIWWIAFVEKGYNNITLERGKKRKPPEGGLNYFFLYPTGCV